MKCLGYSVLEEAHPSMTGDLSPVPVDEPVQLGNKQEELKMCVQLQSCELIETTEVW